MNEWTPAIKNRQNARRGVPSVHDLRSASTRREDSTGGYREESVGGGGGMNMSFRSPYGQPSGLNSPPTGGGGGGSGGKDGVVAPVGQSIASGYKAMVMTHNSLARGTNTKAVGGGIEEMAKSTLTGETKASALAPLNTVSSPRAMRDAANGGGGGGGLPHNTSSGSLMSAFKDTLRQSANDEMERKIHDLEELIRKTKLMCLESLSEEAFNNIYDFFQTNVTSKDNMLNDQQLADLERIVMNACGNNIQKSYVVLFNVQKLLAQEDKLRELRNLMAQEKRTTGDGDGSVMESVSTAPTTPVAADQSEGQQQILQQRSA